MCPVRINLRIVVMLGHFSMSFRGGGDEKSKTQRFRFLGSARNDMLKVI